MAQRLHMSSHIIRGGPRRPAASTLWRAGDAMQLPGVSVHEEMIDRAWPHCASRTCRARPHCRRAHAPAAPGGREHPHHARGGRRVRAPGDAVLDRQGLRGDAASGAQGLLSRRRRPSRCCTSTRPGSSGRCTRCASAWPQRARHRAARPQEPGGASAQGINPFDHGSPLHTDMWKTEGLKQALDKYGFDAAFGGARRDEEKSPRQGAHLLLPLGPAPLGPEEPAARALAALQRPQAPGENRSASSRSPTGPSSTSGNTSTWRTSRSCRSTSRPSGRWSSATAR